MRAFAPIHERSRSRARASKEHALSLLSPRLLLTTGGPALVQAVSRDTCASRSRPTSRLGQSSRSSNRHRARASRTRATRRDHATRKRARSTSRVPRRSSSLALALHAPIPSVLQRRIDVRGARGRARGRAGCVYVPYYRTNDSYYKVSYTSIFICKKGHVWDAGARSSQVVGRQRPAGVARRRARDGDSR